MPSCDIKLIDTGKLHQCNITKLRSENVNPANFPLNFDSSSVMDGKTNDVVLNSWGRDILKH